MTEVTVQQAETRSPGQQIRAARESAGLHIVALAAALKVPVRKLEALEADRWAELTDPTFTRALASSVARHLKLDATAVLAGMPTTNSDRLGIPVGLGQAQSGNESFDWRSKANPVALGAIGLLALAVGVYLMPASWVERTKTAAEPKAESVSSKVVETAGTPLGASEPQADAVSAPPAGGGTIAPVPAAAPSPMTRDTPPANPVPTPSAQSESAVKTGASAAEVNTKLTLSLKGQSWVEVTDAGGKLRLQRIAAAGESLHFEDASAFSVVLGNASAVDVSINGQAKDMSEFSRNNVARFQAR